LHDIHRQRQYNSFARVQCLTYFQTSSPRALSYTHQRGVLNRSRRRGGTRSEAVIGCMRLPRTWRTLNTATRNLESSICNSVNGSLGASPARMSCQKEKEGKEGTGRLPGSAPARGGLGGRPHAAHPRHRDHRHTTAITTACGKSP